MHVSVFWVCIARTPLRRHYDPMASRISPRRAAGSLGQAFTTVARSGSGGSATLSATPVSEIGGCGPGTPIVRFPVGVLLYICRRSQEAAPNVADLHKATPRLTLRSQLRAPCDSPTLDTAVCCYAFCVASATDSATLFSPPSYRLFEVFVGQLVMLVRRISGQTETRPWDFRAKTTDLRADRNGLNPP